jgi:hypothetical protein
MDWKAANEQQQEVRWRIFLMFVVMAILIIRTGVVPKELPGLLTVFPSAPALKQHGLSGENSELSRARLPFTVARRAAPGHPCGAASGRSRRAALRPAAPARSGNG